MTKTIYRTTLFLWAAILCTTALVEASAGEHLALVRTAIALA